MYICVPCCFLEWPIYVFPVAYALSLSLYIYINTFGEEGEGGGDGMGVQTLHGTFSQSCCCPYCLFPVGVACSKEFHSWDSLASGIHCQL